MAKPIGEILVEQGAITRKQLTEALDEQKKSKQSGKRVGEILIDLGFVQEADIVAALSSQFGFPYLSTKSITFGRDICALISKDLADQCCLIPFDKTSTNILSVIMADPSDEQSVEAVEKATHCKLQTFISTSSEIRESIQKQYGDKTK